MLTVHHLGISQSDRIVWLCEELDIPYELVRYERDAVTRMAPPEYKALHPFGTAPVITDGDLVLGESGAIIEYLIATHGGGRLRIRAGEPGYADYLFWFHFANASMMPAAMVELIISMIGAVETDTIRALRHRLAEADYFAGAEFTAADIFMLFPLTTMRLFAPRDLSPYPAIRAYLQRIGQRQPYIRAMAKADPDLPPQLE